MRHKGITLLETLIAITIMSIMAGVMMLSSATVGQQSARREAERVAAFIQGHISRANIAMRGLWFDVNEDNIRVGYGFTHNQQQIQSPDFKANTGCKYSPKQLFYNVQSQESQTTAKSHGWSMISQDSTVVTDTEANGQHCITVTGADNKSLNVIIGRK